MTPADRARAYYRQTGRAMTPRQQKRYRKNALRSGGPLGHVDYATLSRYYARQYLCDRLPGLSLEPADAVVPFGLSTAPAPTPAHLESAGVGVTPSPVASLVATDGARLVAHAPTAAPTHPGPAAVGASLGEVTR